MFLKKLKNILSDKYTFLKFVKEKELSLHKSLGKVYMFHQINDEKYWLHPNCNITFKCFKELIDNLLNEDFKFISIEDICNGVNLSRKSIALTFDDGYSDLYEYVAKYLIERKIPFAIFVTIDYLNKPMYLTLPQLKYLSEIDLCTIGSHTISHPKLRLLNDFNRKKEIYQSKIILSEIISKEVSYFSYPYGAISVVSNADIDMVINSGYKIAFSTLNGHLSRKALKNKFYLPRVNINQSNYMTHMLNAY